MEYFFLCVGQLIVLFFISRKATNSFFHFLRLLSKNEKLIFSLVALLYLPGTIIHEMSHFFAALILFLRVREVSIFPAVQKNYIKLGSVTYERKDFIRGFLVGIAPLGGGMLIFYSIGFLHLFPSHHFLLNVLFAYIIFTVSSTMFSSSQDLVDFLYMIPLFIIFAGFVYVFHIDIMRVAGNVFFANQILPLIKTINIYLLFSLIINISVIIFLTASARLLKR